MIRANETKVGIQEKLKEYYVKRTFLIFSRHEKVKETSMGKDLVIYTTEQYENIVLNGKTLSHT